MNSWLTACDDGNSIISVGSLCVNVHDHFQLQPGIIDANRPVFKSVQCKVILKQNAPPTHTHTHTASEGSLFQKAVGLGFWCWDKQAGVWCVRKWTGPLQGQQVQGTPGGRWIVPLLGLAGRLPGGLGGTSTDWQLECGRVCVSQSQGWVMRDYAN